MRRPLIASRKKHLHNGRHSTLAKTPKERYSRHTRQILVESVDTTDFNILKDVRVMTNRKYSYALKKKK